MKERKKERIEKRRRGTPVDMKVKERKKERQGEQTNIGRKEKRK